jgi:hypothetical protein
LYNRYIPKGNTYERVVMEDTKPGGNNRSAPKPPHERKAENAEQKENSSYSKSEKPRETNLPLSGLASLLGGGGGSLQSIFQKLQLDTLDTGDILLVLILLFLFLEGDNTEMVITLGLLLLMGL